MRLRAAPRFCRKAAGLRRYAAIAARMSLTQGFLCGTAFIHTAPMLRMDSSLPLQRSGPASSISASRTLTAAFAASRYGNGSALDPGSSLDLRTFKSLQRRCHELAAQILASHRCNGKLEGIVRLNELHLFRDERLAQIEALRQRLGSIPPLDALPSSRGDGSFLILVWNGATNAKRLLAQDRSVLSKAGNATWESGNRLKLEPTVRLELTTC